MANNIIKFETVKQDIIKALEKQKLVIAEPVSLVDGFVNQPFNMQLSNSIEIGGPTIPMIMLLGNSGQIYLFALKAIIKDFGEKI